MLSIVSLQQATVTATLKQASMNQWVKQAEKQLTSMPEGLRVINQQLWCCCRDAGIVIFDSELQQQHTIWGAGAVLVYDVAEMSNSDVVIATENGLYHGSSGQLQNLVHVQNQYEVWLH